MRMAARDKRTNRESIAMHVNLDDSRPLDKSLIRLNKQHSMPEIFHLRSARSSGSNSSSSKSGI